MVTFPNSSHNHDDNYQEFTEEFSSSTDQLAGKFPFTEARFPTFQAEVPYSSAFLFPLNA